MLNGIRVTVRASAIRRLCLPIIAHFMTTPLTFVRQSLQVSRCEAKPERELIASDFTAAHKLAFDMCVVDANPRMMMHSR